mmetsp:Transcript_34843/g.62718  ORF Transcript_34843/g.62718 Transcript_34843/m.62718 type:complete len:228 (+) Transcript_34843:3518-4201(+)
MRIVHHQRTLHLPNQLERQIARMQQRRRHLEHGPHLRRSEPHDGHGALHVPERLLVGNAIASIVGVGRVNEGEILHVVIQKTDFLHYGGRLIGLLFFVVVVLLVFHGEQLVEYVIVPLPRRLVDQTYFFQEIGFDGCSDQCRTGNAIGRHRRATAFRLKFHFNVLAEAARVVVSDGARVAERFHDGVGFEDSLFDGHVVVVVVVVVGRNNCCYQWRNCIWRQHFHEL